MLKFQFFDSFIIGLICLLALQGVIVPAFAIGDTDIAMIEQKINLGRSKLRAKPDSAFYYLTQAQFLAQEIEYQKGVGDAKHHLASYFINQGKAHEAFQLLSDAMHIRKEQSDTLGIANSLNNLGILFSQSGQNLTAIDYYLSSLELKKMMDNPESVANTLINLGRTYRHIKQDETALHYYLEALEIYQQEGNQGLEAVSTLNISSTYLTLNRMEEAKALINRAFVITSKEEDPRLYSEILYNLSAIHLEEKDSLQARAVLKESLLLKESVGDFSGQAKVLQRLGDIYANSGKHSLALQKYFLAESILESIAISRFHPILYLRLAEQLEKMGKYRKGLDYKERYFSIKDSLDKLDIQNNLTGARLVLENSVLADSLLLLQNEAELMNLQIVKEKNQRLGALGVIAFFLIILLFYVFILFKRNKAKRILSRKTKEIFIYNKELEQQNALLETQRNEILQQNEKLLHITKELDDYKNKLDKLSYVVEFTENAIAIISTEGKVIWVNQGFIKLFSYAQIPSIKGKNIRDFKAFRGLNEIISESIESRISIGFEQEFLGKHNKNSWLMTNITPCFDGFGRVDKLILVFSDIDELKKNETRLKELNKNLEQEVEKEVNNSRNRDMMIVQQSRHAAMGEMISNIAHQWRQPLNAIAVIVQNMEESLEYDELTEDYLNQSVDKTMNLVNYMSQTIDDFRHFFETDKTSCEFLIKEVVDKAISFVGPSFTYRNIKIELEGDNELKSSGYPNEYLQVVINILNNAKDVLIERNVENPSIKIMISSKNQISQLMICDNAGGIEPNVLPHVFKPYFSTKQNTKGTGIGLYMSKNIIEDNMQGKLEVTNSSEGACFSILL